MKREDIIHDETKRRETFPVVDHCIFMSHAGVAPLSGPAANAIKEFADQGARDVQETAHVWSLIKDARVTAAKIIGASADEISLLGPTSLGLNLVAQGLDWQEGDEVIFYPDDYPANVYPWADLARRGVKPVEIRPQLPGVITWEEIEPLITKRTRLVALASCGFLTGYRIDIDQIGEALHERDILFSVDGIQTVGAFPTRVDHVDFLSADSHKWMLGPVGAGIFYVSKKCAEQLRPSLLGSWNVVSPDFIAQEDIQFERGGRRYEPGTLNAVGIVGMLASMQLLDELGIDKVAERLLDLRRMIVSGFRDRGYELISDSWDMEPDSKKHHSAIISVRHPGIDMGELHRKLDGAGIRTSLRKNRDGESFVRFSPHFYNSEDDLAKVFEIVPPAR